MIYYLGGVVLDIQVNFDDQKNKILVTLNGDLDLNSVSEFKRRMEDAVNSGTLIPQGSAFSSVF